MRAGQTFPKGIWHQGTPKGGIFSLENIHPHQSLKFAGHSLCVFFLLLARTVVPYVMQIKPHSIRLMPSLLLEAKTDNRVANAHKYMQVLGRTRAHIIDNLPMERHIKTCSNLAKEQPCIS